MPDILYDDAEGQGTEGENPEYRVFDEGVDVPTGYGLSELSNEDISLLPSGYTGALTSKEIGEQLRAADVGYAASKKALQDQLTAARNVLLSQPTKQSKADWLLGIGSQLLAPGPVGRAGTLGESLANVGRYVSGVSEREQQAERAKQQQIAQFDLSATQAQAAEDAARRKALQELYYRMQNVEGLNARAEAQRKFMADENQKNRDARLEAARIAAAGRGNAAQRDAYGFGEIISTAANEAAAVLENIQNLPVNVDTGIAGGRKTQSLFTAPIDALVNVTVNDADIQRYNTQIAKLSYYIAQVQKGGRVVSRSDVEQLQEALTLRAGDKQLTRLTKMAEARQALERAFEVRIKSRRTTEELKDIYRENLKTIQKAVPFTVNDINKMASAKDKKKTFKDWYKEIGLGAKPTEGGSDAAAGKKVMIGDREIYAKGGKWYFKDDNTEVSQ